MTVNEIEIECKEDNYKIRMLERNKIKGLLPYTISEIDGVRMIKFDISSHVELQDALNIRQIGIEEIKTIVSGIDKSVKNIKEYHMLMTRDVLKEEIFHKKFN